MSDASSAHPGASGMTSPLELTDAERVKYSVIGFMKFDAEAVAHALRTRPLTAFEARSLANLIDGKNPRGLRLEMRGQGRGWRPIVEAAAAYERVMAVGHFVEAQLAKGGSVEEAVIDAAQRFGISEPTVYRDLSHYRLCNEAAE